ncbi:AAA family ATPase [Catenovulum sediminis]|uniref:AAA family ATPase n=1 Tax=Catenovulum sediminis TaxID=1740262 RepID=A0ABV1RF86_9ALTE
MQGDKLETRCQLVVDNISAVVLGKEQQIKLALTCLLAKGHLLIEDLPGMGKTTLSHVLAETMSLSYNRVQFTSDLLPSDITGVSVYNTEQNQFEFHPGPLFSQLVLADEINRASPKTQSALLEAMAEQQVSIDGNSYPLESPFFVIATQNPAEQSGTHPLPESQLDRFLMRISLGYPSIEYELKMLQQGEIELCKTCLNGKLTVQDLLGMQESVNQVRVSENLLKYILQLVQYTRQSDMFPQPLSPRASRAILQASKAWAYIHDATFVTADHVQAIFTSVAEHRLAAGVAIDGKLSEQVLAAVEPV